MATANNLNVDIVTLNETNLKGKNKLKLEGYLCFTRNREKAHMGGVATCVNEKYTTETISIVLNIQSNCFDFTGMIKR